MIIGEGGPGLSVPDGEIIIAFADDALFCPGTNHPVDFVATPPREGNFVELELRQNGCTPS